MVSAAARSVARHVAFVFAMIFLCGPVLAQTATDPAVPPAKVQELLELLGDSEVRAWLQQKGIATAAAAEQPVPAETLGEAISGNIDTFGRHFVALWRAVPRIPAEISAAVVRGRASAPGYGSAPVLFIAAGFIAAGLLALMLYRRAFRAPRRDLGAAAPARRLADLAAHLLYDLGAAAAFGLASVGVFLFFRWPDPLGAIVLTWLASATGFVLVLHIADTFIAPPRRDGRPDIARPVPMTDKQASHAKARLTLAAGWFAFGYAFVQTMILLGVDDDVRRLIAYLLGLGLLGIGIEAVWSRPVEGARSRFWPWFVTASFILLWLLWAAGAIRLFWLVAMALLLPAAIRLTRAIVYNIGGDSGARATLVERGLRALLILGAIAVLAWAWGIGFGVIGNAGDPFGWFSRAVLIALLILLALDLVWQVTRALIDAAIERSMEPGPPGTTLAIRRAKLRTLLPILRNIVLVFLATLAVLMTLSAFGVQIAPLIASAGVVGVAIGFGAQTLVKDVISGMFYLLDDAFRVGEYIVTGNYKGTVESFSLRSVRLRHHRGPVFTIPFGDLGAVQNLSRDFTVDKMEISVTYDTDVDKVRKVIKQIGQQLSADPELAPIILEPLKMQAVGDFGEYGMLIRLKVKTKPGEQFILRKKAYPMIKKAFDENGIKFASPTVSVAEGVDHKVAAARHIRSRKAAPAA